MQERSNSRLRTFACSALAVLAAVSVAFSQREPSQVDQPGSEQSTTAEPANPTIDGMPSQLDSKPKPKKTAGIVQVKRSKLRLAEEVQLAAARPGILAEVLVEEGSQVTSGSIVAKIDDSLAKAQVDLAKIEVESDISSRYARKRVEISQLAYDNALDAKKRLDKAFTDMEMRRLKLAAEESRLSLEKAEQDHRTAEAKLTEAISVIKMFHFTTPIDGIVSHVHKSQGESVREGELVIEIVNPAKVRVDGYVSYNDSLLIRKGMAVQVPIPIVDADGTVKPGSEYEPVLGKLKFISPVIDGITRDVRVSAEIDNSDGLLKAGMPAEMIILLEDKSEE